MVSGNGLTKRPFYDTAKKLNHEVLAWDHVFLRYDWQGVMNVLGEGNDSNVLFDNTMLSMSYLPCLDFVTASGDTIIGYFTDENGQPAYMVTNHRRSRPGDGDGRRADADRRRYGRARLSQRRIVCGGGGQRTLYARTRTGRSDVPDPRQSRGLMKNKSI